MSLNLFYTIRVVFLFSSVFLSSAATGKERLERCFFAFFFIQLQVHFSNWEQLNGAVELSGLFDSSGLLGVESKENKPFLNQPQAVCCFDYRGLSLEVSYLKHCPVCLRFKGHFV